MDEQRDESPRWSITWLFRVQRVGRRRPPPDPDGTPQVGIFWKAVPWIIMLLLGIEIAVGVWLGLLPR